MGKRRSFHLPGHTHKLTFTYLRQPVLTHPDHARAVLEPLSQAA